MAIGMEDMREEYKWGLLMTRTHLEDRDKSILLAPLAGGSFISEGENCNAELIQHTGEERNMDVGQKPNCQMLLMPQDGTLQP